MKRSSVLALSLVFLASVAQAQPTPPPTQPPTPTATPYPAEFTQPFYQSCVPGAGQAVCDCVLHQLEATIPYATMISAPPSSEVITNITLQCVTTLGTTSIPAYPTGAEADQSTPELAVQNLFTAAQTQQFGLLATLCDPTGASDDDVAMICLLATDPTNRADFTTYFMAGRLNGPATVTGNTASVPVMLGPAGANAETMNLVNIGGVWYLSSF